MLGLGLGLALGLAYPDPHPKPEQVWSSTVGGAQPLFVWRPQPPSAAFVALGHVATSTPQPPPLEAVHGLG